MAASGRLSHQGSTGTESLAASKGRVSIKLPYTQVPSVDALNTASAEQTKPCKFNPAFVSWLTKAILSYAERKLQHLSCRAAKESLIPTSFRMLLLFYLMFPCWFQRESISLRYFYLLFQGCFSPRDEKANGGLRHGTARATWRRPVAAASGEPLPPPEAALWGGARHTALPGTG